MHRLGRSLKNKKERAVYLPGWLDDHALSTYIPMPDLYQSLSHAKWDCKYHIFIPKGRRKALYGKIRTSLGSIFHALAKQKECTIIEGHVMPDHVHMCIAIPPKHAVSSIIGFLKGKSAIAIARQFSGKERNFSGEHFWARGYAVSTVGFELATIQAYIREQEGQDSTHEGNF